MLKSDSQITNFDNISPEALFEEKFSKRAPKVVDYDNFEERIKDKFSEMNSKRYKIITSEGQDFNSLSAGWKTAIILDLILGWESDTATLIIDQPEDNLATTYINNGLISAIKQCKGNKQVILVSHNATIPMLGDAQNVILCINNGGVIKIRSDVLEGEIDGHRVVDHIAIVTDGGKASIKKRVKKYNLKNYAEAPS
jgi:ATPase subunit of ABC transporter with duplicated ATPase domains